MNKNVPDTYIPYNRKENMTDNDKTGKKFDEGKLDWDLLPVESVEEIIKVFMFGEAKYGRSNWQGKLENFDRRQYNAVMRHMHAWKKGEKLADDSQLMHLAHACADIMMLIWEELHHANSGSKEDKTS